jgi:hypothetical protein
MTCHAALVEQALLPDSTRDRPRCQVGPTWSCVEHRALDLGIHDNRAWHRHSLQLAASRRTHKLCTSVIVDRHSSTARTASTLAAWLLIPIQAANTTAAAYTCLPTAALLASTHALAARIAATCSSDRRARHVAAVQRIASSEPRAMAGWRQLALLVCNDGHELVAHGMLDPATYGGSAKEA